MPLDDALASESSTAEKRISFAWAEIVTVWVPELDAADLVIVPFATDGEGPVAPVAPVEPTLPCGP